MGTNTIDEEKYAQDDSIEELDLVGVDGIHNGDADADAEAILEGAYSRNGNGDKGGREFDMIDVKGIMFGDVGAIFKYVEEAHDIREGWGY